MGAIENAVRRPAITILLSTYNGARYLPEQLQSILAQDYQDWILRWRDDGSVDGTVAIMRDFAERIGAQRCVESSSSGTHLGAAPSFLTLLQENTGAEAVAFADQDDVWLSAKLAFAADALAKAGQAPVLYCARQVLVDASLRGSTLSASHIDAPGFPGCLTQNIANGNTLVMNAGAAALVAAMSQPEGTVHDWWSYIVVSACGGRIVFDERPAVLYRLHKGNLIGSAKPTAARAIAAIKRGPGIFMTMMRRHSDALAAHAHLLTPKARRELKTIRTALHGGLFPRLAALRCPEFRRRTRLENVLFSYWFVTDSALKVERQNFAKLPAWASQQASVAEPPRV